ncbi:MAG: hypothetical protein JSS27_11890 [Planctomycetes bacterium]|nr:hypothetical protein [Planctomycetota bacterium]
MTDGNAARRLIVGYAPLGSLAKPLCSVRILSAAWLVTPALWALAFLFAWRRVAGAVTTPLAGLAYLTIAMLVICAASAARRIVAGFTAPAASRWRAIWRREQATLGAAALLLALWMRGTPWWSIALAFTALLADRLWNRRPWPAARAGLPMSERTVGGRAIDVVTVEASDWSQQLRRYRSAAGEDTLSAQLRVTAAAGQRHLSAHVAFCPPFARVPCAEVHVTRGTGVQVKVGQLLPHGARLDLKLTEPGPATIELSLLVTALDQPPQD